LRDLSLAELEKGRQSKIIGKALDAKIKLLLPKEILNRAESQSQTLKEMLNVSSLEIGVADFVIITVSKADGQKCERCWHWKTDIGQNADHPTICGRCIEAVKQFKA
jgi:isoleucyl-tRNA synthetase